MQNIIPKSVMTAALILLLVACDQKNAQQENILPQISDLPTGVSEVVQLEIDLTLDMWQNKASNCYRIANLSYMELNAQKNIFLENPTQSLLVQLRQTWNSAHQQYLGCKIYQQSIPFSFEQNLLTQTRQLDSWPIQGGYVDYLDDYDHTGIINDITLKIDRYSLISQNQLTDLADISIGFHVVEFLLWGEFRQRSSDDYIAMKPEYSPEGFDLNSNNRRRDYLATTIDIINDQAEVLQRRWEKAPASFMTRLSTMPDKQKTAYLLSSFASFITAINSTYFNPEYENDLFMLDESPYSQTTREGLLASFHEFESRVLDMVQVQRNYSPEFYPELLDQLELRIQTLSFLIDELPELSENTLVSWQTGSIKASIAAFQLLDVLSDLSLNLDIKLSYSSR